MSAKTINTVLIFNAETIAAGADSTTDAIDLNKYRPEGYFSLQLTISGSGTAKVEYLLSNNGVDYMEPSSGEDIVTAHTATSGPGADGKDIYVFEPEVARFLKIKISETGGVASIVAIATLLVQ